MEKRLTLAGAAFLLVIIGLLPVLVMISKSFFEQGSFSLRIYEALFSSAGQQALLLGRSVILSLLTSALATIAGVCLGILLGRSDLPGRITLASLLSVPLLLPPYVVAVAWFAVLGKDGWLGQTLPSGISERLSTAFFGLAGCAWVLFTAFMPIVMLLTIAYASAVNPHLENAGRLAGHWTSVLRWITLPLIAPAILFAAVLVFLLTFGEVGVPMFLRYPVYPVQTLTAFAAFYDFGAATASAVPMLLVTLAIMILEYRFLHKRFLALKAAAPDAGGTRIELGRWRMPLFVIASVWALITVVLPLAVLLMQTSQQAFVEAFSRASDSIVRSLAFALIGATLLTLLGFFCGYLVHDRTFPQWRSVDGLALFLFVLPGTVIGMGLISLWNTPMTNLVYATPVIIILGYLAQYTVLPMRMTSAVLAGIPRSLEHAARLGGANWFMTLRYVVAPLSKRGLIAAWLIAYVFCLRDLGISLVVYPPGSDTLPVRILTLMANGAPSLIAALCVILILVTLVPLGAAGFWLRRSVRRA